MAKTKHVQTLIEVVQSTQALLAHYQASLAPSQTTPSDSQPTQTGLPSPLDVIKATTTLLKSHTTTLSLLLITPPLTPSAIIAKLKDVSSGTISGMVAAACYEPRDGEPDHLGRTMRVEVKAQVRRLLGTWGDVLALVRKMAEKRQAKTTTTAALAESEKQEVLATTGVVWEACDTLLRLCTNGTVGLVVQKAGELRAVLLDAIEELQEWGDDVVEDNEDDGAEQHSDEDEDEDAMFGSSNKLGKDDEQLKQLLDTGVKKLKLIGILYQALIKQRLKTYPASAAPAAANGATSNPSKKLDALMDRLRSIPEAVDDMASAFYDLDEHGAQQVLARCCEEANTAAEMMQHNWAGASDEFTAWCTKWREIFNKA